MNLVPQEMGRVLLNLYNHAFYAVQQKQRVMQETPAGAANNDPADYRPTVTIRTRRVDGPSGRRAVITVLDNGTGIPESVPRKIVQLFFTTKHTGERTGPGLSLSYDIVTKGHGGPLSVDSQSDQYTRITVRLPD